MFSRPVLTCLCLKFAPARLSNSKDTMVDLLSAAEKDLTRSPLLSDDEIIVIVDDSPEIILLLKTYLSNQGFAAVSANSGSELFSIVQNQTVALVILDISLPDRDGTAILVELVRDYPDLGVIMATSVTDIQVALQCLRQGADDYLTKPVNIEQFYHTVRQTLKKRRLAIENRRFQQVLQLRNFRARFLHQLILKMNSAYLNALELNQVLKTILVGITSDEGLQFNRAFLALFDDDQKLLQGRLAIGPGSREDARDIWSNIDRNNIRLEDLFQQRDPDASANDIIVNEIVRSLSVPASNHAHPFIYACDRRTSILVNNGTAAVTIPPDLIKTLMEDSFVIVPLFSPRRPLGVLIADNFITRESIAEQDIEALEIFAGQASLAIEHSRLFADMQKKITELEIVTQELDKSKDLLVEAERYSALGHMSAQLVHAIRNPITSIGGTSRLLASRISDKKIVKFLDLMTNEAAKVESTLNDLFTFVSKSSPVKMQQPLYPLIRKSVMAYYGTMKKKNISYSIDLRGNDLKIAIDAEKIQQVFMHLFKNSIEAMANGGALKIKTHDDQDYIAIVISDSGNGIAIDDMSQATDPFYTTKIYGTGLGLTLVEQIIKQHDGTLSITQNEPYGLEVIVRLPRE
jgi:signal transduction histidine kinase/DNA-binding response OmpR family regulator